jgi:outer membrane cobalamin receptor
MNIRFFIFLSFILFSFTDSYASIHLDENFILNPQDSTKINEDTLVVKKPSIIKFVKFDSITGSNWDTPWKISKSKMNLYLFEDIGDVISVLPGAFIFDLGSAGQSLFFTRHGASSTQTTVMFDGRPLYDPVSGSSDLNLLPVGFIKEVKTEQHLSDLNFINNGELLSVKSETYDGELPYSQIYHHKAGLGYSDVDFILGQRISQKMNILLGGNIKSSVGKNNAYSYEHQNLRGKLEYNYSNGWRFVYSMMNNRMERDNPGPLFDTGNYGTPEAHQKIVRDDHTLNVFGNLLHSNWQNFRANIYYSSMNTKLTDNSLDLKKSNESRYAGINFQMKQKMLNQLITIGGKFEHDWIESADLGKNKFSFGSVMFQDDWEWKKKFGLRGLTNLNFHELFGTDFSGGISSYLKMSENLEWIISAQQNIRYPTFIENYIASSEYGASDLKNEIIHKIATGVESRIWKNLQMRAFLFSKNIQRLIQFQENNSVSATFQNVGDRQFYGMDFSLDWRLGSKFQINTIASMLDNKKLYDFPNIQLFGNMQYKNRFFKEYLNTIIKLEGRYIGDRNSSVSNAYSFSSSYEKLSPAFIINATAIFGFGNLNMYLMFENILNEDYQIIYGYPCRDRTFHYGVRWEFWD